jgi:polysaccharide biosynthesis/export protein
MTVKFRSKNIASLAAGLAFVTMAAQSSFAQAPAPIPAPVQGAQKATPPPASPAPSATSVPAVAAALPPEYLIGSEDVLSIIFWRDKEMSSEVSVRPDGMISLPLLNDVHAAGLTPQQLQERIVEESKKFVEDPSVTVVVKAINSRKVFITGEIGKPGPYPLTGPTTVLQLIAVAGGLRDYARGDKIAIMRVENGKPVSYRFNFKEVMKKKNLKQNIELKPGDTIIVP